MKKIDIIVNVPHMFTMEGEGVGYHAGDSVAIDAGKIIDIAPKDQIAQEYEAEKVIDGDHHVLLPGFIDCHMHTRHAVIKGVAQDIVNWMWGGMAPFESQTTSEAKAAGSRLAMAEAIMSGTTTLGDDGPDLEGAIKNAIKFGVRGNMSPRIREVDFASYGPEDLYNFYPELGQESLDNCVKLYDTYNGYDGGRIKVLFGPQGSDFVSSDLMKKVCNMAKERKTKVHMHYTQGTREDFQIEKRYGMRPVPYLDSLGVVDDNLIAVHMTTATPEEIELTAKRGATMVCCTSSITTIGGEVPPAKAFIDCGGTVGLGSDQSPGNNNHNLFNEMKLTSIVNKCKYGTPLVFPAWKVLRMATVEGARAIGLGDVTGSLEVGKAADMILLDLRCPTLAPVITSPMRNLIPNIVYAARGNEVVTSIINGKVIMENRKPLTFDLDEVVDEVQKHADITAEKATPRFIETDSIMAEYMRNDQL